MKFQYLGTAAAEGIPAIFCECDTCKKARASAKKNIRTRSQAIIDGKLLIDFPADTYYHSLLYGIDLAKVKHCLITHTHSDHLYPKDLCMRRPGFSSLGATEEECFNMYGSSGAMLEVNSVLSKYDLDEKRGSISLNPLEAYCENRVGDYIVIPLEAIHDVRACPYIYIIKDNAGKTVLYAHDTNYFSDKVWEYLEKCDLRFDFVSMDCTNGAVPENGYIGHMNLNDNAAIRERFISMGIADEKTIFCSNHFSHNGVSVLYEEYSVLAKEKGIITSFDGMELEF